MKSCLLSIQPKWCELIASGEKTIEVRKTAPKLETPSCYIQYMKSRIDELDNENKAIKNALSAIQKEVFNEKKDD